MNVVKPAILIFLIMTMLTGVVYPLVITGIAKVAFGPQAEGSLITQNGKIVGSSLVGQSFSDPKYFWGRPSATSPYANNASSSSGSNLGPTNPALAEAITARVKALRDADPSNMAPVPTDLVTASGSGLDPHISPEAAGYQANRVAKARGLSVEKAHELITAHTTPRTLGLFGEARVNVLELNLDLDK